MFWIIRTELRKYHSGFVHQIFQDNYKNTYSVDYDNKDIDTMDDVQVYNHNNNYRQRPYHRLAWW